MWTNETITTTTGGILGIIGILLALWGSGLLGRRVNRRLGWAGAGLVLSGIGLFMIATASPTYRDAFGLLATLTAVVIAMMAVKQTRDLEIQRNRQQLLKDISAWAAEIGTVILQKGSLPVEENVRRTIKHATEAGIFIDERYTLMLTQFTPLRMKSVYISEVAKTDEEMAKLVQETIKNLRMKLRILHSYIDHREKISIHDGLVKAAVNIARNEDRLYSCVVNILEQVGKESANRG